jgi:ribose transport system substrate-binding protein
MKFQGKAPLIVAIAAIAAVALAGCSTGAGPGSSSGTKSVAITGVMPLQENPYFKSMCVGAKAAAKEDDVNLTWTGVASADTADLLNAFNAASISRPAGMLLDPFDPVAFVQPVKTLMASGTNVIAVDNALAQHIDVTNVGTDGYAAAKEAGAQLGKLLRGKGSVAILGANPTGTSAVARTKGLIEGLKAFDGITVLPTQYEGLDSAKAADIVSGLIQSTPDLKAVYAVADTGGSGAASAIKAAGKTGDILNVTFDAGPELVNGLKAGTFDALIAQNPYEMGYQAVKILAAKARGEGDKTYPRHTEVGYKWITRDNVDDADVKTYLYASSC